MRVRPVFDHLDRLSTSTGLHEHALLTSPRPEHGFCLDDVARGLVVTVREPDPTPTVRRLRAVYLDFVVAAQTADGGFHNRRDCEGNWIDEAGFDDHWGRALWALGCASSCPDASVRTVALAAATVGLSGRSPAPRSMAYAAIGAADLLRASPGHSGAHRLLVDAAVDLHRPGVDAGWPWPESRLTYANAVLPEAMLAVGAELGDEVLVRDGLQLLTWLVGVQTRDDQLSLVPSGGWQRGEPRPGFDQQPIEAAALAEACRRAFEVTGDGRWLLVLDRCVAWFLGVNDARLPLYDTVTGGGRDGLHRAAVNENQGAESTLAALSTLQLARAPVGVGRP